jgi:hypothetical protein
VAVLVLFEWEGDPDEQLAAYDREIAHLVPREQPRRISHTCARADDGIAIVDVRESAEDLYKMVNDSVFKSPEAEGWQPEPQVLEIYGSRHHPLSRLRSLRPDFRKRTSRSWPFPRIVYTGSPVSEKTCSRQFLGRG